MIRLTIAAMALALAAGCATTPYAALTDFTSDKAEVRVEYGILGPNRDDARVLADPVGEEHCQTLGKTTKFVSARVQRFEQYDGEYIFLYRCTGADRVAVVWSRGSGRGG